MNKNISKAELEVHKDNLISLILLDNEDNPIWLKQIQKKLDDHPELVKELFHYKGQSSYSLIDIAVRVGNVSVINMVLPLFPSWKEVISNEFYHCLTDMNHKNNFPMVKNLLECFYHIKLIEQLPKEVLPSLMQNCLLRENKHFFNIALDYFFKHCDTSLYPDFPISLANTFETGTLKDIIFDDYFNKIWKEYDIDYVNMAGKNILNIAIEQQNFPFVKYLLEQHASIDHIGADKLNSFELFFKQLSRNKAPSHIYYSITPLFNSFLDIIVEEFEHLRQPKRFLNILQQIKDYDKQTSNLSSIVSSLQLSLESRVGYFNELEKIAISSQMKKANSTKEAKKIKL